MTPLLLALSLFAQPACDYRPPAADEGIEAAVAEAEAIAYVRIVASLGPRRVTVEGGCVDTFEYLANIYGTAKASPGRLPTPISFLVPGPREFGPGQEMLVFLSPGPTESITRQAIAFPHYFVVRERVVEWRRTDLPGVANGDRIEQVLEALRALVP